MEQKRKPQEIMVRLECDLTDNEFSVAAKQQAGFNNQVIELEGRQKSSNAQFKAEISEAEAKRNLYATMVSTRKEYREVKVRIDFDFKKGIKKFTRTDTGRMYKEAPIPPEELQEKLPLKDGNPVDPKAGLKVVSGKGKIGTEKPEAETKKKDDAKPPKAAPGARMMPKGKKGSVGDELFRASHAAGFVQCKTEGCKTFFKPSFEGQAFCSDCIAKSKSGTAPAPEKKD